MTEIIRKLYSYQKRNLALRVSSGMAYLGIFMMVIWLSTFTADSAFQFSSPVRWAILVFNLVISFFLLWHYVVKHLIRLKSLKPDSNFTLVAQEIGKANPRIADRLKNIYQLIKGESYGSSADLRTAAVSAFSEEVHAIEFEKGLRLKNYLPPMTVFLFITIGSIAVMTGIQEELLRSVKRILNPTQNYEPIPAYSFTINPGTTSIFQGDDIEVDALYKGPAIEKLFLEYKNTDEEYFRQEMMIPANGSYKGRIQNLRDPLEYRLRAVSTVPFSWRDRLLSDLYTVDVIIPPLVNTLEIELIPPLYTRLPAQFQDKNVGDITAYPGSKVRLRALTNGPIQHAEIIFDDDQRLITRVRENTLNTEFQVMKNTTYRIDVTDHAGIHNQNPIEYAITIMDDLYPTVEIIEPGDDIEISADASVNLLIEGNDDFGFRKLTLWYQLLSKSEIIRDSTWLDIPIEIPAGTSNYFQQNYQWDFRNLAIGFDDVIRYYVSVWDNDIIRGPKESRSKIYTIRFPSIDQIFADFQQEQDENIEDISDAAEKSDELKKTLEELNRELKREKEMDWQRRREMENVFERQKEIQEKIEEVQNQLQQSIERLENNNLLSPEILQKYAQLQELFQEIATPELLEAMRDLQKAIESMDQQQAQNSLQQFKINQEKFQENLERALELFKKVQIEQQLDRLVQMAKKLTEEQKEITEDIDQTTSYERIEQQSQLAESLENNLDPLLNERLMLQYPDALKSLENSKEMMLEQNFSERLEQLRQNLANQNKSKPNQSEQRSQKLEMDMAALQKQLEQAQKNMQQQDKAQIIAQMERTTENLLRLSEEEESLISNTRNASDLSDDFRQLAMQQQNLSENMRRVIQDLIKLSQQTFYISPEMNQALGQANTGMQRSLRELENRNGQRARQSQELAMQGLNDAIVQMQSSMQQLSQSASALGFDEFMKRMQQMAGQQGQINQESMDMMTGKGGKPGGLSLEQQARYRRLSAEQRAIRQSLENMNDEMGNRSDIAGRLDKMAEEMEEVIKDLQAMQIDRKTIERQQKILSRMLDAQKSVREREYSRQRKAEIGKYYARKPPDENAETSDQRLKRLTTELLKALQEGYAPDYEKMIEAYFQELNRQNLQE